MAGHPSLAPSTRGIALCVALVASFGFWACGEPEVERAPVRAFRDASEGSSQKATTTDNDSAFGGDTGAGGEGPTICSEGEKEDCSIVIHQAAGITSCYQGTRTCRQGHWAPCVENLR